MTKGTSTRGTTGRRRVSQVHAKKATATRPRPDTGRRRSSAARSPARRKHPTNNRRTKPTSRTKQEPPKNPKAGRTTARDSGSLLQRLYELAKFGIGKQTHDKIGLVMVLTGFLVLLAFFDKAGPLGRWLLEGLRFLVGVWVYATPVLLVGLGGVLMLRPSREGYRRLMLGLAFWFVGSLTLFHLLMGSLSLAENLDNVKAAGGAIGSLIAFPLNRLLGFSGAFLIISFIISIGVMMVAQASIRDVATATGNLAAFAGRLVKTGIERAARRAQRPERDAEVPPRRKPRPHPPRATKKPQRPPRRQSEPKAPDKNAPRPGGAGPPARPKQPHLQLVPGSGTGTSEGPRTQNPDHHPPSSNGSDYRFPPIELLNTGERSGQSRRMLEETAKQLEETLQHHEVNAHLTNVVPGPTVTRYEIELAPGVKVSRVTNLAGDIAYALATPDVRLLAPIPGRSAIGVEVPNRVRRLVTLGDVLASDDAYRLSEPLVVGLGEDISGRPMLLNLAELPHVLIAGATGAGKSSCINSIVTSLLIRTDPDDVRLIMVDPKRVELGQYNGVPHLLTKVITEPKKSLDALRWAVAEMDRRYDLLAEAGVRDIVGYRKALDDGDLSEETFDRFPYLVILIDELNDLMMVAGRDVESAIVRLAQMARAVGIHLVIATQRPSVNVITGVIKANIPSRLAFSVASQTDSRVIIDTIGADKLVGMGDMLVVTALDPRAKRVQGAWVSEEEVAQVVKWVREQKDPAYMSISEEVASEQGIAGDEEDGEEAELIRRATELVIRSQLGSTSMLQRKLRIGFARAGRIMDTLEQKGIVGPSKGSKAREVLVTVEDL